MDIYEPLPVLLSFEKQENTIILRLDANGLGSFIKGEKAVQEITIKGCDLSADIIEEFEKYVNQVFEHEVFQQGNKLIFQLWADYGRLENEFECDDISKSFSEYTTEDLLQKGSILYNLYVDLHKKFTDNEGINYQLRKKLTFEIANEIERSQRKVEFFENEEKAKADTLRSEIKFLQKLQKVLD